jgi:hypothetical protein
VPSASARRSAATSAGRGTRGRGRPRKQQVSTAPLFIDRFSLHCV